MSGTLRHLLPIGRLSAAQALRSPVYPLVWLLALLAAGGLPLLDYLALHEKQRLVVDSLLALSLTFGALLGMMLAVEIVGAEVHRGTLALLRARGVEPSVWLTGRLLGLAAALAPFAYTMALAVAWGSRVSARPFQVDSPAATGWLAAVALAVAVWALSRGRLRLAWLLPAALSLAAVVLRAGWMAEDWRWLPASLQAYGGMVLACWVAGALALAVDGVAALWLAAVVFLVGVAADSVLTGLGRALWLVGPSWSVFGGPEAGWWSAARAWAYLLAYGAALVGLGGGLRAVREPR